MSSKQYDIAVIGGSLAARIAAALLAKQGSKVLFLRNREASAPAWFHSSLILEKLLGVLGGRSCFVAQLPIQVISEKSRITLSNDISLEDEIAREFGPEGTKVSQWLSELNRHGVRLEELFLEHGGLPWPTFKDAARFKLLCIRSHIDLAGLEIPVLQKLGNIPGPARAFITDLLQGLSLSRIADLTYAKAALLWAQALRPENLQEPDFSQMLNKRFDQFHGAKASLDDLEALDFDGTRWVGGHFKSGGSFTAETFLLGDKRWIDHFKEGKATLAPHSQVLLARRTSNLHGQLSSLLKTRIVCGGELPLRLAIEEVDDELQGLILSVPDATEADIRQQLGPALPFAEFQLRNEDTQLEQDTEGTQAGHLRKLPIQIGTNLYCADRTALFPEMGAAGAALLAWTLTEKLGKKGNVAK